jgi:hypothetical protein
MQRITYTHVVFLADDGGVSGAQADGNTVRQHSLPAKILYVSIYVRAYVGISVDIRCVYVHARMCVYKSYKSFNNRRLQSRIDLWPPFSGFLDHTHTDTRSDSSGLVISPLQRPLPTQDNTTYKHKRQTSMLRAGFKPATSATKRPQTYALHLATTGIG